MPEAARSLGRAQSLAWRMRAQRSPLQWPKLLWEQWDLAPGPPVFRAHASSIPRKLGQPWPPLCQAGRRVGTFLGGPAFLHLPVPMPWLCPPGEQGVACDGAFEDIPLRGAQAVPCESESHFLRGL